MLFVSGCHHARNLSPQEIFQETRLEFLHGHLLDAQDKAHKAYLNFSARSPEWAWKFRLLEAEVMTRRGLSQEVLTLLNSPLPSELNQDDLAAKKHLLEALAYARLGNFLQAEDSLKSAEQLCENLKSSIATEVVSGRGVLYASRDQPELAEKYFRTALHMAQQQGDGFMEATSLLNMGVATVKQQHYDESIDWSTQASAASQHIDAGLTEEKSLGNLAWAYYKVGDFEKSLSLNLEAQDKAKKLPLEIDQVRWLNNLGLVYYAINQPHLAKDYFQQSLVLAEKIRNKEQTITAHTSLTFLDIQTGQFDEAEDHRQRAYSLLRNQGDRLAELYLLLAEGEIAARKGNPVDAEKIFSQVALESNNKDASLRWQAQDSLANLYAQKRNATAADVQYRAALNTLECARGSIPDEQYRLPFLANAGHVYDDYIHFQIEQGQTVKALQIADYNRARTLAEGLGLLQKGTTCGIHVNETVAPQAAARKVDSTVLFYSLGPQQSYLWAVTGTQTALVKLPAASEIGAMVQRYRKSLLGSHDVLESQDADGIALYKTLIEPAQRFIAHGSRVMIVPDQTLNNLNFETLLVPGTTLHYWIEDVTISYASSLKMLVARHTIANTNNGKLLLIGDPVVPDPKYPQLPEAGPEMQQIKVNFSEPTVQIYAREAATPLAYLDSKPEQYSYIHFVAHGTASQLSPLDSAIVLSQATAEEDSFKLRARDIIAHRITANLVTISACYGSGSMIYDGEGLVGLSWGFIRAGAHNVIGALWAVSDKSTSALMGRVYFEIKKGRRPEDALRDAKLALLRSDSVYRKPVYWAPFQFYVGS